MSSKPVKQVGKTLAQQWMAQGRLLAQQEMEKTLTQKWFEEGFKRGRLAVQRQGLQQVLCHYFPVTPRQQEWFVRAFASIDNTEHLAHLVDQLLTAPTLADFEQAVLAYLPPEEPKL